MSRLKSFGWLGAALLVLAGGQIPGVIAQSSCFVNLMPTSAPVASGGITGFNNYLTFYAGTNCDLTITSGYSWLRVMTARLGGSGNINTQVDPNTSSSSRSGSVQVAAPDGKSAAFLVQQGAACTPTGLLVQPVGNIVFSAGLPVTVRVTVSDSCGNLVNIGSVAAAFSNSDPTLTLISVGSGIWQGTWTPRNVQSVVTLNVFALTQQGSDRIVGAAVITATLNSGTSTPPVIQGISDTATYQAKAFSPGSFISIFGTNLASSLLSASTFPLPTNLGGTGVIVGDKHIPLIFVSPNQINAILPYSLPVSGPQQLIMANGNSIGAPITITAAAADPGIFTVSQDGLGAGIITNQDFTLNSAANPAARGSTVVIYCAGLGAVSPAVADGASAPASPLAMTSNSVVVSIGNTSATVMFAGLTPGYAGLYQVNAVVPATIAAGSAVPVSIGVVVGSSVIFSPTVTMAVR